MNTHPLAALVLAVLASTVPLSSSAQPQADNGIQHCQTLDGTTIYADKDCTVLGATRVPMSSELLARIAYENAMARDIEGDNGDGISSTTIAIPARRSPASGCAWTPTQLGMDLQGAFALRDINRIAESYHWAGKSHAQGQQIMDRLDQLTRQPLVDAQFLDAQIGPGTMRLADVGPMRDGSGGMMQLRFGHGMARRVLDMDVVRYHGCYFVAD